MTHNTPTPTSPGFPVRALKVNLPWASYRQHASLDLHDSTLRDPLYWEKLLDFMVDCRLNLLSLWSLHPFPWMAMPPDFPEGHDFTGEEMAGWQSLWSRVFAMAHERGIQTYVFFWNIFVSQSFARAHGIADYCLNWDYIGDGDTSDLVRDYNRACVRTLIDTYPDLDGLGLAMSERMGGMSPAERAEWVEDVTIAGINQAKRSVDLCLRIPHSAGLNNGGSTSADSEALGRDLLERVRIQGKVWTEIKFNWSHGHSTPHLRKIHGGPPSDTFWKPPPEKYSIGWMVRNEDFFVLRWASPGYVREHIRLNGIPGVCGYFIGSECHIPGKDYISRPGFHEGPRYAFERNWLFYEVWGRLLADPDTPDETFEDLIDRRHGSGTGKPLLAAYESCSLVPLRIACFLNYTWDHTLYAEGFLIQHGFATLDDLIVARPIEPDWLSVEAFVRQEANAPSVAQKFTPILLAKELDDAMDRTLEILKSFPEPNGGDLAEEIADIHAWIHLGRYFADKLRAAVHLARHRIHGAPGERDLAAENLETAIQHWRHLAENTAERYQPIPLQILGDRLFSWQDLLPDVERDRVCLDA
ncbi:MAG: hypothetical protein JJU29_03830 [Verrucomicrobia bacterium]|nr:hypothetical protein [Verrucomicrobiota bacterium]MCH8510901.1 hypothetical protein [Kiritimatiellia bacterium]